ncbi:MAG: SoxR reducing system RseC family protein [Paludibacteraceae bacterium]
MNDQIEHEGTVVRIDGVRVYVRITQQSACAACHAKGLCTASESVDKIIEADAATNTALAVGDSVTVTGKASLGFKAVGLAFIAPFCLLLAVLFAVQQATHNDLTAGACALAALIPYYSILAAFRHKMATIFRFSVHKNQ